MKRVISVLTTFCVVATITAQSITINKQLKDFPDTFDLSTPLKAGITCSYLLVNGKEVLWRDASSYLIKEYFPKGNRADQDIDKAYKKQMLNACIREIIVYKDSIACMITEDDSSDFSIRMLGLEDGKWLNIGEDLGVDLESAQETFYNKAPNILNRLRQAIKIKSAPSDTLTFLNYVNKHGVTPKKFLLGALSRHPLVIYGELHRRKVSWDFLKSILHEPDFIENVGTVFVELPSYQQSEFDRFYTSKEFNREILLEIMRSEQIYGWWDKGEYEFLIDIWKLNKNLPSHKQIKVVAVDEQAPYKLIKSKEEFAQFESSHTDRNTNMANVIEKYIKLKQDKRNCLFIVGFGHAYKSYVPGTASTRQGAKPALTAGSQLTERLSDKNVFIILQHVPMGTNAGALGLLRHGFFDMVFEKAGNTPIAFNLSGSPFGAEPFDADYEMCFDSRVGSFADNFDGYIFLAPLKDEDADYILYDIWSEEFVKEVKRRAYIADFDINRWLRTKGEITGEKIITLFKGKYEGKKRWNHLFE